MKKTDYFPKEIAIQLFYPARYIILCYINNISNYKNIVFDLKSFVCQKNTKLFQELEGKK
jgi:hypothetical protein